jgi:chromatin segregation and condensation protein Rec8/ScpA/Scc1 (kleisin family)
MKIHSLFTEEELALKYNSIEKLKEHEEIKKFIKWLKNKPDNFYDVSRRNKTRHDRKYKCDLTP